jgi:hypothetical protein
MIRQAVMTVLVCGLVLCGAGAFAQERVTLGWGRLFDNDVLGDLRDRWHSGSYTISLLRGPRWTGALPADLGALLEYRLTGSTLTAANVANPAPGDRRYAGSLSVGIHSHAMWAGMQASLGVDLVATGPQTGIGRFQSWLHGVLGAPKPDLTGQMGNRMIPTFQAELGRDLALGDHVTAHPFVAAQAGVENLVRAGGDIVIGNFGQGGFLLRDDTTGQRYRGIAGAVANPAMSLTLGGDVAHVFGSDYLPAGGAAQALDTRTRLRAGLAWQGQRSSAFYGVTYLAPEFDGQTEGQLVGSVNLNFRF